MKTIKKIAIANRGEVACRIHRTCKNMGIKTILLHSEPDRETLAYRMCDITECIGGATATESYLNIDHVIAGALKHGADAIHPGFGFLSENVDFAKKVSDAGLIFIGPTPETIASFGDKKTAKELCMQAQVPTIPGYKGDDSDIDHLTAECDRIGYPVIVKATAGGGGRGMRIINNAEEAAEQIQLAKDEAQKAFGNSSVFLEKYLNNAKHIEVQVFGDYQGNIFVLGERECSVQRKHQKIIEETPSTSLTQEQRATVHKYAKQIAEIAAYKSAGTVEFLFENNNFYFLEVNTRLQVEHPVTEEVFGVDLVEAQILTAQEQKLTWPSQFPSATPTKASIELRLYAEDPYKNGAPSVGKIGRAFFPAAPGRRFEYGIEAGDRVSPYYDSMIAKVIATKDSRIEAINELLETLNDLEVFGVFTNKPLLLRILKHPDYILNKVTTQFFAQHFGTELQPQISGSTQKQFSEALAKEIDIKSFPSEEHSPWSQNWREPNLYPESDFLKFVDQMSAQRIEDKLWWSLNEDTFCINLKKAGAHSATADQGQILSPMPGNIFKLFCHEGDKIKAGDTLLILEAMKMEHSIKSPKDAVIKKVHFKQGENVQAEDLLVELS